MLNALRLISLFPRKTIPTFFCYSMLKPKHHVDFNTICYLTVYLHSWKNRKSIYYILKGVIIILKLSNFKVSKKEEEKIDYFWSKSLLLIFYENISNGQKPIFITKSHHKALSL